MTRAPLTILLVEDNTGDIELIKLAFEEHDLPISLCIAHDGLEALQRLHPPNPLPDLILLDLNLPKMSGMEFLDVVRQEPHTAQLPIIILTSSKANLDIQDSYKRHANCYIIKPNNLETFMDVAKQVETFWIKCQQDAVA